VVMGEIESARGIDILRGSSPNKDLGGANNPDKGRITLPTLVGLIRRPIVGYKSLGKM
jgi:hypothetical protein